MRVFYGAPIAKDVASNIFQSLAPLQRVSGVKLTKPENYHITLRFIGEICALDLPNLIEHGHLVACGRFIVDMGGSLGGFPSTHQWKVAYLPVEYDEGNLSAMQ
ncbi:MAG: 2'-5' RNA ligase family protein [bacterium]|nr:2'-5' RNA ligase family protein [bacterium]